MSVAALSTLGYDTSPNFLGVDKFAGRAFHGHEHMYRKAQQACGLQGVYLLADPKNAHETPVVFYCKANDDCEAATIRKKLWNQGLVPFLLIETPSKLRLYSGFRKPPSSRESIQDDALEVCEDLNEVLTRLASFRADAIDSGEIWSKWGDSVNSNERVDWTLLEELEKLGKELRRCGLTTQHAHSLIGKFVYLKYLRDRDILSPRKLSKWGVTADDVFGPHATLNAFWHVIDQLDDWLNGSVFPLARESIKREHLQLVASVFSGGTASGQLPLDLGLFDFSFVPIETLSVIYQQFLHATDDKGESKGKKAGAYYTPLPVVNYMLTELEAKRPLEQGMQVLDPSCGSGAFLVQCYRTLVEKYLTRHGRIRLRELRTLLQEHIFGVDRDPEACQVAEMSLILALLDYTTPPDLEGTPTFKLPTLNNKNIFRADFFDPRTPWAGHRETLTIDWLVGNPPWVEAKAGNSEDRFALDWMKTNADLAPTGGNQIAEAFVWHSLPLMAPDGVAGLLLPAMTLFKSESDNFRRVLFEKTRPWCVANFANLAYVLFGGRGQDPALALFYEKRGEADFPSPEEPVITFSPFLAEQPESRAGRSRRSKETWTVVVNSTAMREIPSSRAMEGDAYVWKEATWGSHRDGKLLQRLNRQFPSLEDFAVEHGLIIHQGLELRNASNRETVEHVPELEGKLQVDFSELKNCGTIFSFPEYALSRIPAEKAYVRKRSGMKGLIVSKPPHIIVDKSRRFAVYSDQFIAVPPSRPGISGPWESVPLLQAISLYLSSMFCKYQQFFTTPEWGVRASIATLQSLRNIPIPMEFTKNQKLNDWVRLHEELSKPTSSSESHLEELDKMVLDALGFSPTESVLVSDFVTYNMQMVKGKVPSSLIAKPVEMQLRAYLAMLQAELDSFIGQPSPFSHDLCVLRGTDSAMVSVLTIKGPRREPQILEAGNALANSLVEARKHLIKKHSQWLHFERRLMAYQCESGALYMLKPLEMMHWTQRQAVLDADEIIAETLGTASA